MVIDAPICKERGAEDCRRRLGNLDEEGALPASTELWLAAKSGAESSPDGSCARTVAQLRELCRERGLRVGGRKAELLERLQQAAAAAVTGGSALSLLLASPHEGRTHQVRLHCRAAGVQMIGDDLYGCAENGLIGRQALHSLTLQVKHPHSGEVRNALRAERFDGVQHPALA